MKLTIEVDVDGVDPTLVDPHDVAHVLLDEDSSAYVIVFKLRALDPVGAEWGEVGYRFVGAEWGDR